MYLSGFLLLLLTDNGPAKRHGALEHRSLAEDMDQEKYGRQATQRFPRRVFFVQTNAPDEERDGDHDRDGYD